MSILPGFSILNNPIECFYWVANVGTCYLYYMQYYRQGWCLNKSSMLWCQHFPASLKKSSLPCSWLDRKQKVDLSPISTWDAGEDWGYHVWIANLLTTTRGQENIENIFCNSLLPSSDLEYCSLDIVIVEKMRRSKQCSQSSLVKGCCIYRKKSRWLRSNKNWQLSSC